MFPINDALDAVLLGTFLFGLLFTVGTLLLGVADLGMDHGADHGGFDHGGADHGIGEHSFASLFNVSSILAFITWFGGVGYLVHAGLGWHWIFAIVFAIAGGIAAGWFVLLFFRRILRSPDDVLDPHDYERVGVLARVTSSIRSGGVGEIVWEQRGTRMVTSARSSNEEPIGRGTEVLILKVDRGMAIVEPFDGLLEGTSTTSGR